MKKLTIVAAALLLGACGFTPQGSAAKNVLFGGVEKAGAAGLDNAESFLCRLAPVGTVKDRYGVTDERAAAYATLCKRDNPLPTVIAPAKKEEGAN